MCLLDTAWAQPYKQLAWEVDLMYYIVPSINKAGATEYLILKETFSAGLVIHNCFDHLDTAREELYKLDALKSARYEVKDND